MRNKNKNIFFLIIFGVIFISVNFVSSWTNSSGGDHGGEDWTPINGTNVSGIHYNIGTFTIPSGFVIYIEGYQKTVDGGNVSISATTINISGVLDSSGRGYGGGGGASNNYFLGCQTGGKVGYLELVVREWVVLGEVVLQILFLVVVEKVEVLLVLLIGLVRGGVFVT